MRKNIFLTSGTRVPLREGTVLVGKPLLQPLVKDPGSEDSRIGAKILEEMLNASAEKVRGRRKKEEWGVGRVFISFLGLPTKYHKLGA